MEPAIVYFELRVNDPQRQGAIYSSLFGWKLVATDPPLG
jgi:predicted enzyme related to lactoylglutathione lyase